jgi:hypothetical protein
MMRVLKWLALTVAALAAFGFLAFLYFIPPFFSVTPEDYVKQTAAPAVSLEKIADPAERAIAERGKYIVMITGCSDCHSTPGPEGPNPAMYLAGGMQMGVKGAGTAVSRNLTPDPETGLGSVKDEDILRVLRSGVFRDGRRVHHRHMPWNAFANWTEEDRHAVLAYLRQVMPIAHSIPDPVRDATLPDTDAMDLFFGRDFGSVPAATP